MSNAVVIIQDTQPQPVITITEQTVNQYGSGGGGGGSATLSQVSPVTSASFVHNLNELYPEVSIISSTGQKIYCDIQFNTVNQLTLSFTSATAFTAIAKRY